MAAPIAGTLSVPYLAPEKHDSDKNPEKKRTELTSKETTDERLADYTWWLVIVTAALCGVAAIQTKLLFNSDRTAKELVGIAERQMLITGRQTDIIEKQHAVGRSQFINAKRELRAYVTVEPDGINQLIGRPDVIGHVVVRNVGKLPARNVTLLVIMERSKHPEPEPGLRTQIFKLPRVVTNADRVIQPGGEMRQGSQKPYIPISDLIFPDYNVYVHGIVRYDDGYGRQCFTRFCHRYATAGRNRSVKPNSRPTKSRAFISADKARYHNYGNSAESPAEE